MTSIESLKMLKNFIINGDVESVHRWWLLERVAEGASIEPRGIDFLRDAMRIYGASPIGFVDRKREVQYRLIDSAIEYARCYE